MVQSDGEAERPDECRGGEEAGAVSEVAFPLPEELTQLDVIKLLEAALREKDDIIQAQYAEIASLHERLALGVRLLNEIAGIPTPATTPVGDSRLAEMYNEAEAPTSSNIGHG